jgi:glycosyltransferase involved in cell wall biosynthesis
MMNDLSIIIPVFNESKTIDASLSRLLETPYFKQLRIEFIVVDDGSTDDTVEVIKKSKFWDHELFQFFFHKKNKGKASAIRTALPHLRSKYTIIQDGDLEYHPEDIGVLFDHAKKEGLSAVYGSRNLLEKNKRGGFFFFWGGRFLTSVTNILYSQSLTDMPTCYKLIKTELLQSLPLRSKRFEFCPEVTARIAQKGIRIEELPIQYSPRSKNEGKKIKWRDGLMALWTLVSLRLVPTKRTFLFGLVFLFAFSLYLTTWNGSFVGYERETADAALGFFEGEWNVRRAGVGAALLYLPFILIQKLFFLSAEPFLTLVPVFYSALTVVVISLLGEKLMKKIRPAIFFGLVLALGSALWPYSVMGMEYQAGFFIPLLLYALLIWREKREMPLWAGMVFGLLCITKSYGVLLGLPYLLFLYSTLKKHHEIKRLFSWSFFLQAFGPAAFLFGLNLGINYTLYGSFSGVYSLAHEFQIQSFWEGFYGTFFAAGKSIFLFNPLLLVSFLWWKKFFSEQRETSIFILTSFVILLFLTAPFIYWSDETWGVRKLVPIIPLLHIPLLLFFEQIKKWATKFLFAIMLAVSVYVQFLGASYNYPAQLSFLREVQMDSLTTMRYVPAFSHPVLYHKFFLSYLNKNFLSGSLDFSFQETSWFRWTKGEQDIVFTNIKLSLESFEIPNILWFQRLTPLKKSLFFGFSGTALISLLTLCLYCRKNEDRV